MTRNVQKIDVYINDSRNFSCQRRSSNNLITNTRHRYICRVCHFSESLRMMGVSPHFTLTNDSPSAKIKTFVHRLWFNLESKVLNKTCFKCPHFWNVGNLSRKNESMYFGRTFSLQFFYVVKEGPNVSLDVGKMTHP